LWGALARLYDAVTPGWKLVQQCLIKKERSSLPKFTEHDATEKITGLASSVGDVGFARVRHRRMAAQSRSFCQLAELQQ